MHLSVVIAWGWTLQLEMLLRTEAPHVFLSPYLLLCWLSVPKLVFPWLQGGGCSS